MSPRKIAKQRREDALVAANNTAKREHLDAYTKEIVKDPEAFMRWIEPLKEHTRECKPDA